MTRPREELARTGRIGRAGAHLLYRTVRAVAVARNFPPPSGGERWTDTDVAEIAHGLIDGDRGQKRLKDALVRSTDEASFARVLEGAAVNYLRDLARATDQGKVVLRVAAVLKSGPFEAHGGRPPRWGLPGGPTGPSAASAEELARAAMAEPNVVVPAWNSERRDAPIADKPSLVRVLNRVLAAANGGVTAADAARAVAARLDVRRSPLTYEVGVLERIAEAPAGADPADQASAAVDAAALFARLDDRERIALAMFHAPLPEASLAMALGRSQTALLRQRLVRRLQREAGVDLESGGDGGGEESVLMIRALRDLCAAWTEGH